MDLSSYITYVIQPGDTLSGIAARYGTTCQVLISLNGLAAPCPLCAGKTLRVPENEIADFAAPDKP